MATLRLKPAPLPVLAPAKQEEADHALETVRVKSTDEYVAESRDMESNGGNYETTRHRHIDVEDFSFRKVPGRQIPLIVAFVYNHPDLTTVDITSTSSTIYIRGAEKPPGQSINILRFHNCPSESRGLIHDFYAGLLEKGKMHDDRSARPYSKGAKSFPKKWTKPGFVKE